MDQLFVYPGQLDQTPHPGRMTDNTAIGLILASFVFILFPHAKIRWVAAITQHLTAAIALIGALII